MPEQAAIQEFKKRFGYDPHWIAIAPGRINLIGEHTDYNEGFVFPAAIDKKVYLAATAIGSGETTLGSTDLGDAEQFALRSIVPGSVKGWGAYPAGVAWALRTVRGLQPEKLIGSVSSEVPIGAGLSSSAAIEMAFAVLWNQLANANIPQKELALICQQAENKFVGVNSGIMDQMASAMGRAGQAMFLDTRSLEIQYASMPEGLCVVVCDTGKPRALTDSAYNERRSQCEEASKILGVKALRDADMQLLEKNRAKLSEVVYRRAKHVITENNRCIQFKKALQDGDLTAIGELMRASHVSLRDDYEVSSKELDTMAEAAWSAPGCIGARMTGAGFGGACVAIVETPRFEEFKHQVEQRYKETTGLNGKITSCQLSDGAAAKLFHNAPTP